MRHMGTHARRRMDERYRRLGPLSEMGRPHRGWIRAVRDALGMSTTELARRLGVSHQRVTALEHAELRFSVQLNTLKRVADAVDCELVYVLVPRTSLTETVKRQARRKAEQHLGWVAHHSRLENQETDDSLDARIEELAEELTNRRGLWSASPHR